MAASIPDDIRADDYVVDPIREFYTTHPYPPPVENLDRARDEWRDEMRHRAEFHLFWPDKPYRGDLDILVAGCGTWQAAKYALCRPDSNIVGIDVSETSLEHTQRLKEKYKLSNLEIRELSIENAKGLDRQFDLIVCTGVLHHLVDPGTGLGALRSVLKPDGAIYLMMYAPYGRSGVYLLQEYCRQLEIGTSEREINDLGTVVETLPPNHPLVTLLRGSRDALDPDALADALLNPRDRAFSVPELFKLVNESGLKFGRWYWQAPYLPQCGAFARTPHAERVASLSQPERYAAMELWRGLMSTHSVIAYKDDSKTGTNIRFDDEKFTSFVPIRRPATLCVQERLPVGAAGVLLNQGHQFHDLLIVVGAEEKRMFDAIDGCRSIGEIEVVAGGVGAMSHARTFFEKLWRYDQVVFDSCGT
jgi:SAM-dependent methyltransferase